MNRIARSSFDPALLGAVNLISLSAVLARYSVLFLPLCALSVLPYCVTRLGRGAEFYRVKRNQAKL
jgi:hypothetical protein